jgi:predicted PurR-regulated permease PerM
MTTDTQVPKTLRARAEGGRPVPRSTEAMNTASEKPTSLQPVIAAIAVVAALYFGRDIFVPLALALLLTFALSPVVSWLRRWRVPRIPAVMAAVAGALMAMLLFGAVVASQLATLAENLPLYQQNITMKVRAVREASVGEGIIQRASRMLETLGREIERDTETDAPPTAGPGEEAEDEPGSVEIEPIPVLIREPAKAPLELLRTIVGPLVEPVATGGIVLVFVIFMLIRREDLRDRFIRLMGASDIHRSTTALQDAGRRVGQYLLMQLVVNVTYAIPVGIGLWIIGVPNAVLWGLLALVLRFIPYVGPIIAALFPLALAVAVDPGWTMLVWAGALFVTLELISNNFVEPWLYGSRTGLSPVAIILAAIFWTWLWGPIGLLLSTPLTVCLVVLGRHVPQFQFLDVLLGNEPVLSPSEQLYQRLLAGDPDEATDRAEEFLRTRSLVDFYGEVAMPALILAEEDRARGVLDDARRERVADGVETLVDNLAEHVDVDPEDEDDTNEEKAERGSAATGVAEEPDAIARDIVCAGGRGNLDDASVVMLADVLERAGATVAVVSHEEMVSGRASRIDLMGKELIIVGYLNEDSAAHARYVVRRLRRLRRDAVIAVAMWGEGADEAFAERMREKIRCDHVVGTIGQMLAVARDLGSEEEAREAAEPPPSPKRRTKAVAAG